jgi:hypothetical protein
MLSITPDAQSVELGMLNGDNGLILLGNVSRNAPIEVEVEILIKVYLSYVSACYMAGIDNVFTLVKSRISVRVFCYPQLMSTDLCRGFQVAVSSAYFTWLQQL